MGTEVRGCLKRGRPVRRGRKGVGDG